LKARGGRRKGRPARAGARGERRARKVQRRKRRKARPPEHGLPPHSAAARRKAVEAQEMPAAMGLLQVAVPLWMEQFKKLTWQQRMSIRDECLGAICTGEGAKGGLDGIALLACGAKGKPGQVAGAFNALAKALALGALQPGGVTFGPYHWEEATP
jgi:hypothetical protein